MFSKGERPMFCLCRWQWANVWGLGNEGARRRSERLLTLAQIYIKRNTAVDGRTFFLLLLVQISGQFLHFKLLQLSVHWTVPPFL